MYRFQAVERRNTVILKSAYHPDDNDEDDCVIAEEDDYDDEASRRATVAPASGDVLMTAREADSDTRTETTEDGGKKNDKIMK